MGKAFDEAFGHIVKPSSTPVPVAIPGKQAAPVIAKPKSAFQESFGGIPGVGKPTAKPKQIDPNANLKFFEKAFFHLSRGETAPAIMAILRNQDPVKAYLGSTFGKTKREIISYVDVLDEIGYNPSPENPKKNALEKMAMGILLDVALDPKTYLTGGLTKLGKLSTALKSASKAGDIVEATSKLGKQVTAFKKAGKVLELGVSAAEQAKLGQRALVKFAGKPIIKGAKVYEVAAKAKGAFIDTAFGSGLARGFVQFADYSPELKKIVVDATNKRKYLTANEFDFAKEIIRDSRKLKLNADEFAAVTKFVESPKNVNTMEWIPEKIKPLVDKIKARNEMLLSVEQQVGVATAALGTGKKVEISKLKKQLEVFSVKKKLSKADIEAVESLTGKYQLIEKSMLQDPEYIAHIVTKDGRNWLRKNVSGFSQSRKWQTHHSNELSRKLLNPDQTFMTVDQANVWAKKKGFKGDEFFHTDPSYIQAIRGQRHAKAVSSAEFMSEVSHLGKTPTFDNVAKGMIEPQTKHPLLGAKVFDPQVAGEIDKVFAKFTDAKEVGGMLEMSDKIINHWKAWCVAGDNKIINPKTGGLITIKEFVEKKIENVYCFNMSEMLMLPVKAHYYIGKRECLEVKTTEGNKITAGINHKFITKHGWVKAKDLKKNEKIGIINNIPTNPFWGWEKANHYYLKILGYLIGDGSVQKYPVFYNGDYNLIIDFLECCKQLNIETRLSTDLRSKNKSWSISMIRCKRFISTIKEINLHGKTSKNKTIPDFIFSLCKEDVSIFIAALWNCDGHVSRKRRHVSYYSISYELIKQLKHLLLRYGIKSKLYEHKNKYSLEIDEFSDIEKFKKNIPLIGNKSLINKKWKRDKQFTKDTFGDILWAKVKSVENVGIKECYDLSTETENYVVENFITHNTLFPFPAYHVRNYVSAVWNNWLAGVKNPQRYVDATLMQAGKKGEIITDIGKKITYDDIIDQAKRNGVLGRGWAAADIVKDPAKRASFVRRFVLPTSDHAVLKVGARTGEVIENNVRLAHFTDMIKKGLSPEDAAISVKKFQFDYTDLTDFEKGTLKRLAPFYTWTRKNLPLQLEQLFKQPGKVTLIEKLRRSTIKQAKEDEILKVPGWLNERAAVRFATKTGPKYFPLEGYIPTAEIMKLGRLPRTALELLRPDFKAFIELVSKKGHNFYFDKPIIDYTGETKELMGLDLNWRVEYSLRIIRGINELDRLFGRKAKGLTPTERAIRFGTGIKLEPLDIKKAKRYIYNNTNRELRELQSGLKKAIRDDRVAEQERIKKNIKLMVEEMKRLLE